MHKAITVLGATGTIGASTLEVLALHPDKYRVFALTANNNVECLLTQCMRFRPQYAVLNDELAAVKFAAMAKQAALAIEVKHGVAGLEFVASHADVDIVMAAIVGAAGLLPTLAAANSGKRLLLANKEALVMSGQILLDAVARSGATLLPIDSEHNAVFQSLPVDRESAVMTGDYKLRGIERVTLTASGGPFRSLSLAEMASVTPEQAIQHPNWKMGPKISVDSATMMNKGLELIEACWLFNLTPDDIEIVIHRESVIHAMVAYNDGAVIAQLSAADMRVPIAHALAWPERIVSGVEPLTLSKVASLNFECPDVERFPCLPLASRAYRAGGTSTAILNAANEVAVNAFLGNKLAYTDIATVIAKTLERTPAHVADTLDTILADDRVARDVASDLVAELAE